MPDKNYRVLVAHPGKQHSFRLATALKRQGMLAAYVTTVYDKQNSSGMKLLKRFLSRNNAARASGRRCEELNDDEVVQFYPFLSLITLLLLRIDKKKKLYNRWNGFVSDRFGIRTAKLAIKLNVDMVIAYDSNAGSCFRYLKEKAPRIKRVIDVSHSYRIYEKALFERDMQLLPEWAASLKKEKEYLWTTSLKKYEDEVRLTDYFLAPSGYVKETLIYAGVKPERIAINPYGVDLSKFSATEDDSANAHDRKEPFFIFVGSIWQTKGIGHLMEAFKLVNAEYPDVKIHLVGGTLPPEVNARYGNCAVSHGYVQHSEMAALYRQADAMVFPSLSEGMTLSGLEALGCGIPIICTDHSGVNDLIRDGVNGFVVPACDSRAIADKVLWMLRNADKIPEMKRQARKSIEGHDWEDYYRSTAATVRRLCEDTDK